MRTARIIIVSFTAVLGLFALCESARGNEPTEGLIGHWKFDEGEGTRAYDSAGGNHGTLVNGALWTSGQIDGALDFDGADDYVDLGNDSSLKPPLPVTLSAWVRFSQNGRTIIGSDDSSSAYYGMWMDINVENHATVAFGDGTGWGAPSYRRAKTGTTALSPDVWYHVVGVARGATDMSIYINGADDRGSYSGTGGSLAYSNGNATIATSHYHDLHFEGKIDDARIYNRALSAGEIQGLYNRDLGGHGSPIAHWKFDEGEGTTAFDSVGNNHGAIHGAYWAIGKNACALDFDGVDDYVDLTANASLKIQYPLTIAAWVRTAGDFTETKAAVCLGCWTYNYYGVHLAINSEEKIFIQFGDGVGGTSQNRRGRRASTTVSQDTWYHIAGVITSPTSIDVYVDGVDDGASYFGGYMGPIVYGTAGSAIGKRSPPGCFDGKIDDVRIYDRALTPEEIQQLYQYGLSGHSLPIGPMTAVNNVERAIRQQVEEWKRIDDTLGKELTAYKALEQMLQSGDYGDLSYDAILTARQQISTAIQHSQKSKESLEKSIEDLEAALAALGFELVPKASAWLEQAKRAMP